MTCDIATKSNSILDAILDGKSFDLPAPDLSDLVIPTFTPITFDPPSPLTTDQLTEVKMCGEGVFDKLMSTSMLHLRDQMERGSFSSDQVAKIYSEMIQASMATGVQFLLNRDQSYWAAVVAQQQAQTGQIELARARVDLEVAKTSLYVAQLQALNQEAEFGLTKAKLATEEAQYCTLQYTLNEIMPVQKANLTKEGLRMDAETLNLGKEGLRIDADKANMVIQGQVLTAQKSQIEAQTAHLTTKEGPKVVQETTNLATQNQLLTAQKEQTEAQTAHVEAQTTHLSTKEGPKVAQETTNLTAQKGILDAQKLQIEAQTSHLTTKEGPKVAAETTNLGKQGMVLDKQAALIQEQTETQRAQTLDTRNDGSPVKGAIGKQKDLQSQQIISYKREIDLKLAKLYSDAWVTMKSVDEGITPPTQFTNVNIDSVLSDVKAKWTAGV